MNKVLTIKQIQLRFRSEWVLVADPEVNENMDMLRGKVVFHSKDRDEVDRKAIELRLKHSAFLYTGKMPENTEIIL
jgi:hypothetical protein